MKTGCFLALLPALGMPPVEHGFAGDAAMVAAAAAGDDAEVRRYLDQGRPVDGRDQNGKTPLIAASQHGHRNLVKLLLDRGASVGARTQSESTALYYAAQNHHPDIVRLLYANGAEVNTVNRNGFTPLGVAVLNGDAPLVELLLKLGADPDIKLVGQPLLAQALRSDELTIFRALLSAGADVNAAYADSGETPLMIAVAMQRMPAVKLLLRHGADIRATDHNDKGVVHWLLCNSFSKGENTPLLALLLERGADYERPARSLVGFRAGSTPVLCAVSRGFRQSVRMLLAKGPDLNHKDSKGHTALYYAMRADDAALVELLLRHGADPTLESAFEREASRDTEIGGMLLAALQPTLKSRAQECPRYQGQSPQFLRHTPPALTRDLAKSGQLPIAETSTLDALPPVADTFSLSPEGKWLVVREDHQKTPRSHSQRLIVYDIPHQLPYFLSPKAAFQVTEAAWLANSLRYVLDDKRRWVIDVSGTRPRLSTLAKSLPKGERLYGGGEPCPWRNAHGEVVLTRPERAARSLAWSSDGEVVYSLQAGGDDGYYLVAQTGEQTRRLIRHSPRKFRQQFLAELEQNVPPDKRAEYEKWKTRLQQRPLDKLVARRFALCPNGRYLYYRIGQEGGPSLFGLPDRNLVIDLKPARARVWRLDRQPLGTPQWHPNGRDLYFIDRDTAERPDPAFPPMRQPSRARLVVARFPGR